MTTRFKTAALALVLPGMLAGALPANAVAAFNPALPAAVNNGAEAARHDHDDYDRDDGYRRGGWHRDRYDGYRGEGGYRRSYDRPVRAWRGDDGRYYCRRSDGTTGLLVGGVVGGVLGHEIAGRRGDRTLGVILGAGAGALLGREIDRGGSRCR